MKSFIPAFFLLLGIFSGVAQESTTENPQQTISFTKTTKPLHSKPDLRNLNLPKNQSTTFFNTSENGTTTAGRGSFADPEIEPFAQLDVPVYGQVKNVETDKEVFYSLERIGNTLEIKTYTNDLEIDREVAFDIPASTNGINLQNHYSTNFFENDGKAEFMVFLHYFEDDIPGPENQISETWVVTENGDILQKLEATATFGKFDGENNKKVFTFFEDEEEEEIVINAFNPETWELDVNYSYPSELLTYFMGSPLGFYEFDGEEFIVLAHYKHLFMDNMTLEIFPDNNLVITILDLDLETVDTFYMDIETRYPGEFYIPRAEFGGFYRDNTYNLSKDIFNSDDKFEIVYGISYYNLMMDVEWSEYILANEDGEILKELNETILMADYGLAEIDGFDNQIGLLFGENGMATNLGFFDIESWEMVAVFEAVHNGDLLSTSFNRIPTEDSYHWVIGLGEPDIENGTIYGVINEYALDQTVANRHQFRLNENILNFEAVLSRHSLNPDFYINDGKRYFTYVYMEENSAGLVFNNLVIVDEDDEKLIEFRGDTEQGNVVGTTLYTDADGTIDKMAVKYQPDFDMLITDFYRLPLVTLLGIEDEYVNNLVLFPNPTEGQIHLKSNAEISEIQIIDLSGRVLYSKTVESANPTFNFSELPSGMYIAKIKTQNGDSQNIKFIKK